MLWLAVLAFFSFGLIPSRADSVLVLPFFNQSRTANLEWLGESIAETIRESLAVGDVLVLGRDERVEAFRRLSIRPGSLLTQASVVKLAQALDATRVIYGDYEVKSAPESPASKASIRILGRVLDLKAIKKGPQFEEFGALEDLAAIETHLAWQTLRYYKPDSAPSEEEFRRTRPPLRVDALENYIRGLLAPGIEQKQRFFTQAARLDPRFSQPCFHLGRMYVDKEEHRHAIGWLERVTRADSHFHEAQFLLGLSLYYTGEYARAEAAFHLVVEEIPLNEVYNNLAATQSRRNLPAAAQNFSKALEGDDSDPDYHFNLGFALWKRGQFDVAADKFRAALDRKPDDAQATLMLGRCLNKSGPRPGDPSSDGLERIKHNYEETAYRQLKAALEK